MHLLYKSQTQLSFRLIVRTLSAKIYLSNSPGVFGHRAILIWRGRDMAGGFSTRSDFLHIHTVYACRYYEERLRGGPNNLPLGGTDSIDKASTPQV